MANKTQGRRICIYLTEETYKAFQAAIKIEQKKKPITESAFGNRLVSKQLGVGETHELIAR
jgi:hypothetical protein